MRCIHELNYTRIPCNRKSFLRKIFEAATPPHNAEVSGAGTASAGLPGSAAASPEKG